MEERLISQEEFLNLSSDEAAKLVRASGDKVVVFPINGTRRWFTLEHGSEAHDNPVKAYLDQTAESHIQLYRLFFQHGIETLITPVFGPDLLLRSDEYMRRIGAAGLAMLTEHPAFLDFYERDEVRVHFYGDHRRYLDGTEFSHLSDKFDAITEKTRNHKRFRLFFGVFGNDATQAAAEYSIQYFQQHKRIPEKRELIEMYYGEAIGPVSLFIGFDRFSVYDMPLIATGEEDLYFTVSPSLYMNTAQLRRILYDHLYTRRSPDPDYDHMSTDELQELRNYYVQNREHTLGIGKLIHSIWTPALQ
jgi:tuberculosinol/isotuberculosinol synthase